jgi:hypothetical protein
MSNATQVLIFFAQLMPELRALVQKLFESSEGDLFRAREKLRDVTKHIDDHGEKLKAWEADVRQRLDEARERAKKRETGEGGDAA